MNWVAISMLTGDVRKFRVIVFGVALASTMMAHQMSVFWGVMRRTVNQILDVSRDGIWVMDRHVPYLDEIRPIPESALQRIRGVEGVRFAVPLHKSLVRARTATGGYRQVVLLGLDDASLYGAPSRMVLGDIGDLKSPDAVVLDKAGYSYLWPGEPLQLGRILEINERRARLVGICQASPPFQTLPIMYTRYQQALEFGPQERHGLSFVLVEGQPQQSQAELCARITRQTGWSAMTGHEFCLRTVLYYFRFTGISLNFGIVVSLGFIVGVAIAGQNFYLFTVEHLAHFAVLKAMGASHTRLVTMIMLQASIVGVLGYCMGMGLASLLIDVLSRNVPHLSGFELRYEVMLVCGVAIMCIMLAASGLSIRRVLTTDPVTIFRG